MGLNPRLINPVWKRPKFPNSSHKWEALKQTTDCTSTLELYLWKADDGNRSTWTRPHCSLVFCEKPGFTPVHKVYLEPYYRAYGFLCLLSSLFPWGVLTQSIVTFQLLHHAIGTCYDYHLSFASALDSWESELGVTVHLLECWWALRVWPISIHDFETWLLCAFIAPLLKLGPEFHHSKCKMKFAKMKWILGGFQ